MFFIAYAFKGQSACVCRTSENCKPLVLQDKCNIEIFLSSANTSDNRLSHCTLLTKCVTFFKFIHLFLSISCLTILFHSFLPYLSSFSYSLKSTTLPMLLADHFVPKIRANKILDPNRSILWIFIYGHRAPDGSELWASFTGCYSVCLLSPLGSELLFSISCWFRALTQAPSPVGLEL